MAAGLRQLWHPGLDQGRVEGQGGKAQVLGGLLTHLAPSRGLSVGVGGPLQVDGSFHGLKHGVPLFGVELKTPLARVTPPAGLKGEGALKERKDRSVRTKPDFTQKKKDFILTLQSR